MRCCRRMRHPGEEQLSKPRSSTWRAGKRDAIRSARGEVRTGVHGRVDRANHTGCASGPVSDHIELYFLAPPLSFPPETYHRTLDLECWSSDGIFRTARHAVQRYVVGRGFQLAEISYPRQVTRRYKHTFQRPKTSPPVCGWWTWIMQDHFKEDIPASL